MDLGTILGTSRRPGGDFNLSEPVSSFVDVVRRVVLQPVGFFGEISRRGNFTAPLLFALICLEISAILGGLLGLVGVGPDQSLGVLTGRVVFTPIAGVMALLAGTGVLQLLVRLIVGAENSGFEATFRVHSYAWVANLVGWIPVVGPLLSLYAIYLAFVGIREMHGTTTVKAALVVLVPVGAILSLALLVLVTLGAMPWRS